MYISQVDILRNEKISLENIIKEKSIEIDE